MSIWRRRDGACWRGRIREWESGVAVLGRRADGERRYLVLHERDQRRDHDREPIHDQRGNLEAERLARSRRHHRERVAPGQQRPDGGFLAGAEGVEPEDLAKHPARGGCRARRDRFSRHARQAARSVGVRTRPRGIAPGRTGCRALAVRGRRFRMERVMATRRKVVPEGWIVRAGSSMQGRPSGGARSREALPLGHATGGIGRGVGPPGHPGTTRGSPPSS